MAAPLHSGHPGHSEEFNCGIGKVWGTRTPAGSALEVRDRIPQCCQLHEEEDPGCRRRNWQKWRMVKADCPAGPDNVVPDHISQNENAPPSGQRVVQCLDL